MSLRERLATIKMAQYYRLVDIHMQNMAKLQNIKTPQLEEGHTMGAPTKVSYVYICCKHDVYSYQVRIYFVSCQRRSEHLAD